MAPFAGCYEEAAQCLDIFSQWQDYDSYRIVTHPIYLADIDLNWHTDYDDAMFSVCSDTYYHASNDFPCDGVIVCHTQQLSAFCSEQWNVHGCNT